MTTGMIPSKRSQHIEPEVLSVSIAPMHEARVEASLAPLPEAGMEAPLH